MCNKSKPVLLTCSKKFENTSVEAAQRREAIVAEPAVNEYKLHLVPSNDPKARSRKQNYVHAVADQVSSLCNKAEHLSLPDFLSHETLEILFFLAKLEYLTWMVKVLGRWLINMIS